MSVRFAVIADIHGNARALEAVLADMDALGLTEAVNLGDHFSGPLEAAATAKLLRERDFASIRGNHDRWLIETDPADMGPSDKAAFDQLGSADLDWLASLPASRMVFGDVLLCHGTPKSDVTYWLERVEPDGTIRSASLDEIESEARDVAARLILCGHTHIPRLVRLRDGRSVLNPGSVGCPAYDDDAPFYHVMQTGTPNASYAIVEGSADAWRISFRSVPYASAEMADLARANGRSDWAKGLATGWFEGAL